MSQSRGFSTISILQPDPKVETLTVSQGAERILEWLDCRDILESVPLTVEFETAARQPVQRNLAIVGPSVLVRVFAGKVSCQPIDDNARMREAFNMKDGQAYKAESELVGTPEDMHMTLVNTKLAWDQVPSHLRFQIAY